MKKQLLITSILLFLFANTGYAQLADSIKKIINTLNLSKDNYVFKKCLCIKANKGQKIEGINVRTNRIIKTIVIGVVHPDIHTIVIFTPSFRNGESDPTSFRKIRIMLEDRTIDIQRRQMLPELIKNIDNIVQTH